MATPQAQYQLAVYNTTGDLQAVLVNWQRLTYNNVVLSPGTWAITISEPSQIGVPLNGFPALFVEDGIVEVKRKVTGGAWYTDFVGFVRDIQWQTDEGGNLTFTASGDGTLSLVGRRTIAYNAGTNQTERTGRAGRVMAAFVEENAGPSATVANGRKDDGVTPYLTVLSAPLGSHWEGARFQDNVLVVIQGIAAQVGDAEYEMRTTVGGGAVAFVFAIIDHVGTDKSATVVFSQARGNVGNLTYALTRSASKNRVFVLGPGEQADRLSVTVNDIGLQAASPWALAEAKRDATQQNTEDSMTAVGAEALELAKPFETVKFLPIETDSSRYGVQYELGDSVTCVIQDGTTKVLRILSITVTMDGGTSGLETIDFDVTVLR